MKGNVAEFCIILIVVSSVLEINAMAPLHCGKCTTKRWVRELNLQDNLYHPQKVTGYVPWLAEVRNREAYFAFVALVCTIRGEIIGGGIAHPAHTPRCLRIRNLVKSNFNEKPSLRGRSCVIQGHVTGEISSEISFFSTLKWLGENQINVLGNKYLTACFQL